jgi:ABC-type branched-subunit amino acid transport system substrate-binding protein
MVAQRRARTFVAAALAALAGCNASPPDDAIPIGVLLSYSGYLAANSTNSERALTLAVEAGNAAGGIRGRPVRLVARDTRSDPSRVTDPARALADAGAVLFIGPDTPELAVPLVTLLADRAIILPSFATAHSPFRRPPGWFVMGTGTARVACELNAQLHAADRKKPIVLVDTNGYNDLVSWELTRRYGIPHVVLPTNQASNTMTLQPITSAGADAYVLATLPASASSLVFAMAAVGALKDPTQWYLSPTLHTPAFLDTVPKGLLAGARGVAPGTVAGAADFRARFGARWQDRPLDDAYSFYDAGAIAMLALQRAVVEESALPGGLGLIKHIVGVTHAGGVPVQWNELDRGFRLLEEHKDIEYIGLTGLIEFDVSGQTSTSSTNWWTIGPDGFADIPRTSECNSQ